MYDASLLPDFSCSGQWTIALRLDVAASALEAPPAGTGSRLVRLLSVLGGDAGADTPGWPHVLLRVASDGAALQLRWGVAAASREVAVVLKAGPLALTVVRDGDRLGAWAGAAQGGWLLDDVGCVPDRQEVTHCSSPRALQPPAASSFRALRCAQGQAAPAWLQRLCMHA